MIPQPDDNVTTFIGKHIWEVFAPGQMMEGDVMDFLIDDWRRDPERIHIWKKDLAESVFHHGNESDRLFL